MEPSESITKARQIAEQLLSMRADRPTPPAQPRRTNLNYLSLQHHMRWFDGVLRLYRAAARAIADQVIMDDPDGDARPVDREPDELIDFVRRAHRILLEHPVAAKAAYAALARQGRAFAATR